MAILNNFPIEKNRKGSQRDSTGALGREAGEFLLLKHEKTRGEVSGDRII